MHGIEFRVVHSGTKLNQFRGHWIRWGILQCGRIGLVGMEIGGIRLCGIRLCISRHCIWGHWKRRHQRCCWFVFVLNTGQVEMFHHKLGGSSSICNFGMGFGGGGFNVGVFCISGDISGCGLGFVCRRLTVVGRGWMSR